MTTKKKTPRKKTARKTKAQRHQDFLSWMREILYCAEDQRAWYKAFLRDVELAGIDPKAIPNRLAEIADLVGIEYGSDASLHELTTKSRSWIAKQRLAGNVGAEVNPVDDPPAKKGFSVNIPKLTATLNGKTFDLTGDNQARWLHVLATNPGVWVSGPRMEDYDPELLGVRTDRARKDLPGEIEVLIETTTRKGARLTLA